MMDCIISSTEFVKTSFVFFFFFLIGKSLHTKKIQNQTSIGRLQNLLINLLKRLSEVCLRNTVLILWISILLFSLCF